MTTRTEFVYTYSRGFYGQHLVIHYKEIDIALEPIVVLRKKLNRLILTSLSALLSPVFQMPRAKKAETMVIVLGVKLIAQLQYLIHT